MTCLDLEDHLTETLQAARLQIRKRLAQGFAQHEFMWKASLQDCEAALSACQHYRTLANADLDGEQARKNKRFLPHYQCSALSHFAERVKK